MAHLCILSSLLLCELPDVICVIYTIQERRVLVVCCISVIANGAITGTCMCKVVHTHTDEASLVSEEWIHLRSNMYPVGTDDRESTYST